MVARQQLVVGLIPTQNLMVARQQLVAGSIPTQSFKKLSILLLPVQPLPSTVPVVLEYSRFPHLIVEQRLVFGLLQNLQSRH